MSQSPDSIKTPTLSEVESSFTELNDAIIGHTKWLTEWNTRVICGIPVEDQYTSEESHKECYFGRWLYGEHADFLQQEPEFSAINDLHHMVHNRMRVIVEKANNGEPVTRTDYQSFIDSEASFSESIVNLRDELYKLLLSFDHLTGAFNRQAFFHILDQEYARVTRFNEPGCVVLLDVDNFKNINDKFGHAAGDKTLIFIASFIIENIRPYDSICRYGGEEFIICMPKTTIDISHRIIDRIREELSQKKIYLSDSDFIKVSASFGIAQMSAEEQLQDTIKHADNALYQAKASGRNKVGVWAKNS
jgi:diguanylate cyclase